jgi:hypothetical protein
MFGCQQAPMVAIATRPSSKKPIFFRDRPGPVLGNLFGDGFDTAG